MAALEFRPYRPADRDACRQIIRSQVGSYLAVGEEEDFEQFLDELDGGKSAASFWVAFADDEAVGCGGAFIEGQTATLTWGILKAGQLSKGTGRALLLHRLEWLQRNHPEVGSVFCDTAPLTEGFFAKHGFSTYHRQAGYWGGKLELVAMELSLDGVKRGPERMKAKFAEPA